MWLCCTEGADDPIDEKFDPVVSSNSVTFDTPPEEPDWNELPKGAPTDSLPKQLPKLAAIAEQRLFTQTFSKAGSLGIALDHKSQGLCIADLGDGAFAKQNSQADEACRAQRHDFVVGANGKTDGKGILDELRVCSGAITLSFVRTQGYRATIERGRASFGVDLGLQMESTSLDVLRIRSGALHDYNSTAPNSSKIKPGDLIIAVNGVEGEASKLLDTVRTAVTLFLSCRRAPAALA